MLLLDAGTGTELLELGLPRHALPESWLVERPEMVAKVHANHAAAGAQIVLTCTFNLAGPRLRDSGIAASSEVLARRAVELARANAPWARIAGAIGPTLLAGTAAPAELRERYAEAYQALAAAGADLLWTESHWDLAEARAALAAARATGLPSVATFSFVDSNGKLAAASGEPALACLRTLAADGATAVGTNCILPGAPLAELMAQAAPWLKIPLVAKPSAGLPGKIVDPPAFATWVAQLANAGASWLGGCCGATAAHLAAIARFAAGPCPTTVESLRPVYPRG
ncbi:MAG TPA: homocysteine S-methyltransferase family protein [Anaeromyxobacteraceae bacterium]|nr:homocysteine S-methyltransferase family protein [Anaeromyxobacteraceae bacterium]